MDSRTPAVLARGHHASVSPEAKKPQQITVGGFRITTQKLPILKADPIEEMTKKNQEEKSKLEVELKTYTSNMIKESILVSGVPRPWFIHR